MAKLVSRVLALTLGIGFAMPIEAAEICVSCAGPDATYRCAYEGASTAAAEPSLPLACLGELSKLGAHQSCTVERKSQKPCPGPLKLIARPAGTSPPHTATVTPQAPAPVPAAHTESGPATPEAVPDTSPEAATARGKSRQPNIPPKTVKEMVDKSGAAAKAAVETAGESAGDAANSAAKETESALSKAGNAVTGAAKKTWKCVTSLFGDC